MTTYSSRRFLELLKAKAASEGETRIWADGKKHKKLGRKWVTVGSAETAPVERIQKKEVKAQRLFDYAVTSELGDTVSEVLGSRGVSDYPGLVKYLQSQPVGAAHKIFKEVVDRIEDGPGNHADKQSTIHLIGQALVRTKENLAAQPKVRMTIKRNKTKAVQSKTGKTYREVYSKRYDYEMPPLKPSAVAAVQQSMGGWTVTGPLSTKHVKAMVKTGKATGVSGKPVAGLDWTMPDTLDGFKLKYSGTDLQVRMRQYSTTPKGYRKLASEVDVSVPYAFAVSFVDSQVKQKKIRNSLIYRMVNSKGFKEFLGRDAA
jgi:hypothetical protein